MSDSALQLLKKIIEEEVWRAVSRSAGLVGGMNIGKYSGENVNPIPNLGSINDEQQEESSSEDRRDKKSRKRRQNGTTRPR